ncbi:delta-lactam-biosynthetic de-N-acetylase [Lachnospiraceae bacterium MD335]|nr:delta-lactam-biosynthetic de-N-acetylase [Lachnospiraceae bacterium MD335]
MNLMNFRNRITKSRKSKKKQNTGAVQISQVKLIKAALFVLLLTAAFLIGRGIAYVRYEKINDWIIPASGSVSSENWGLGFGQEGSQPTGNATAVELQKYDTHFVGDSNEKVIYLTFDAGFENGNTQPILDALKKHNVPATFFVVGHYLESAPDLVKQMVADGHFVGNHTYHHLDMSSIASKESFEKEMKDVETKFEEITGKELAHFYRPPQGKYNTKNLEMAKDLGYHTFFWSLAYVDWYQDKQPTKDEAFKKLVGRIHPGAIVLLHSTSKTNGEILDELLTKWEEMGYTFRTLEDFVN